MKAMSGPPQRVVIIGGGFGGAYTALHLEQPASEGLVDVTLISLDNYFLFTPMLAEIVSSQIDTSHSINPLRRMLRRTNFVEGRVESLNLSERTVEVIYATGERGVY